MKPKIRRNKRMVALAKHGVSLREIGEIHRNEKTGEPLHHTTVLRIVKDKNGKWRRW